ncbi:MAG: aldo/keto reductase [Campylobacterales bacterium]
MRRRDFLHSLVCVAVVAPFIYSPSFASKSSLLMKKIPSSGEYIPSVGMGTWITFNVGSAQRLRDERLEVLDMFFKMGGGMIDSSPMYGSSEEVLGYCLRKLGYPKSLFSATKVWTSNEGRGDSQITESMDLWGVDVFDLVQVHNLLSWEAHLETLQELKKKGTIRYTGITTSHGSRHRELEKIMKTEDIDFVQFTYNVVQREAEKRLLPLAKERGIAVIINRPFEGGELFNYYEKHPLPSWASEYDINNWAQFFLKFIISHPSVTCAIPATTQVQHMKENMGAMRGVMPDEPTRQKMASYIKEIS